MTSKMVKRYRQVYKSLFIHVTYVKTLHLVASSYYMVLTQGEVSFPLECGLFYCLLLLPGIMSDQNTTMLAQPPHFV